jgi:hypothetical protein
MLYRSFSTNLIIMTLPGLCTPMCMLSALASRFSRVVSQYMHGKMRNFEQIHGAFRREPLTRSHHPGPAIRFSRSRDPIMKYDVLNIHVGLKTLSATPSSLAELVNGMNHYACSNSQSGLPSLPRFWLSTSLLLAH